jgi:hypothetical protein
MKKEHVWALAALSSPPSSYAAASPIRSRRRVVDKPYD